MKKLIAIAFVATFAVALVACGGGAKTEEAAATDTVSTPAPAPDTTAVDTTATDTTAAK
jgi:hypothetical protein